MIADLGKAAQVFGNRATGTYISKPEQSGRDSTSGGGTRMERHRHRRILRRRRAPLSGLLEETEGSVGDSVEAAEQAALVMLGSPSAVRRRRTETGASRTR